MLLFARLEQGIADLPRDRDSWREQAQRLLLTAPKPPEASTSRWRWLRTTG
jgi:hypothetical protein